ncbi:Ribose-phosphate pyrophosphokinase 2 [Hibiscus syriacus]|uniref:ribose-phosphate diphosphokinase n=1 Tax=Hibiscus syriacus TaxID=106335 RepID=A0A6A2X4A4_HIBSY|nr:Ribose-phosphate pyrophosphokinase 2 [Hibiscus syriacus]
MDQPLNIVNGKPVIPILNERTLPKVFESARLETTVNRNSAKIKLFYGTANPALSQIHFTAVVPYQASRTFNALRIRITCCILSELMKWHGTWAWNCGRSALSDLLMGKFMFSCKKVLRGCDVYIVQPTCPPANENLMELLIIVDACRRASAKNITVVIPYFGYARADRKTQWRESIAAKLVANLITEAGANRVLSCNLHSGQSMGYFDIPVDHVYCQPVILDYLASKRISSTVLVVVSPDVGGVARARAFAKKLSDAPLAIVDKGVTDTMLQRPGSRLMSAANWSSKSSVMNLIGDVKGKVAVMVDDMIDTAGTMAKVAELLHQEGAKEVYACCTHAVFSPPARERLSSGIFQEVIITNTLPVAEKNYFPQITVLSVANLLGETIWRVHDDCSVSSIFH